MANWITVGQVPLLRPASAPPAYIPPLPGGPGPGFPPGQGYGPPAATLINRLQKRVRSPSSDDR